jgi:hypothetical protein
LLILSRSSAAASGTAGRFGRSRSSSMIILLVGLLASAFAAWSHLRQAKAPKA